MLRHAVIGLTLLVAGTATAADWQDTYQQILDSIRPRAGEAPWLSIPWQTSVQEAQQRAAAEGKPIFVWAMAGEPLGCT
jgi:hypothetical protein